MAITPGAAILATPSIARLVSWALLGGCLLVGCFQTRFEDGQFSCAELGECPPGFACASDGVCRRGAGAAVDAAAFPDAPPDVDAGVERLVFPLTDTAHDAEELADGVMSVDSPDLALGATPLVAVRIPQVAIPARAIIARAHVQFAVEEVIAADPAVTVVSGDRSADAASVSLAPQNLSSRPATAATVTWDIPPWNAVGDAGPAQRSPDLSAIVQEIVDLPGWSNGNALVLLFSSNTGQRDAASADAPMLPGPIVEIEWFLR